MNPKQSDAARLYMRARKLTNELIEHFTERHKPLTMDPDHFQAVLRNPNHPAFPCVERLAMSAVATSVAETASIGFGCAFALGIANDVKAVVVRHFRAMREYRQKHGPIGDMQDLSRRLTLEETELGNDTFKVLVYGLHTLDLLQRAFNGEKPVVDQALDEHFERLIALPLPPQPAPAPAPTPAPPTPPPATPVKPKRARNRNIRRDRKAAARRR